MGRMVAGETTLRCYRRRHGKPHDVYASFATGRQAPIPRHSEIKESLVQLIKKQLALKGEPPK